MSSLGLTAAPKEWGWSELRGAAGCAQVPLLAKQSDEGEPAELEARDPSSLPQHAHEEAAEHKQPKHAAACAQHCHLHAPCRAEALLEEVPRLEPGAAAFGVLAVVQVQSQGSNMLPHAQEALGHQLMEQGAGPSAAARSAGCALWLRAGTALPPCPERQCHEEAAW